MAVLLQPRPRVQLEATQLGLSGNPIMLQWLCPLSAGNAHDQPGLLFALGTTQPFHPATQGSVVIQT